VKIFVREPALGAVTLGMLALMAVFIVLPQVQVVFVPGIEGYVTFFQEGPNWLNATRNSITVMLLSTTTAVLLGFVYAYAMVYSRMPWRSFFRILAVLPMLSPPFVVAASYILLFGPRGLITAAPRCSCQFDLKHCQFSPRPDRLMAVWIWSVRSFGARFWAT
jgi:iron(III) transport system permease protein